MRVRSGFLLCAAVLCAASPLAAQPLRPASNPFPATSSSASARDHFAFGQRAMDVGRVQEARAHWAQAVAADSTFALAHLELALLASSLPEYQAELDRAGRHAQHAGPAEQLLIRMAQADLAGNVEGQMEAAQQLVQVQGQNPRAWLELAVVQSRMGHEDEARASMARAAGLAPDFVVPPLALGASLLSREPRDPAAAEAQARRAVALEPNEPVTHDLLGDVHRLQGRFEEAAADYTRAAELDPANGSGLQQRGHANTFLGRWDQARADYEAAAALGRDNERASFPVWRALVSVHAGNPAAAVAELQALARSIDGMDVPDRPGSKLFALETAAAISIHHGMDASPGLVAQIAEIDRAQAAAAGSDEFRRRSDANVAYWEGMVAARRGDRAAAEAKAAEMMRLREPDRDPRKNDGAHALMGFAAFWSQDFAAAAAHFAQADPNDIYVTYHHALALDGSGHAAEARPMFQRVAAYTFNSAGLALVRADALRRTR
jgi:tetratricopeptide (TPR) repeat protein